METRHLMTMTRIGESWGEPPTMRHMGDSKLIVSASGDTIRFDLVKGEVHCNDPQAAEPERSAFLYVTRADALVLSAFLAALPPE